ncbi:hypothetical protein Vadar_028311 [Vaccinium darrowii]|uniref:Uncharacterized protein n=1 Tax=Vaccinium darrowii TaxID=229202 RepID=A0ACB7XD98_9ERIC|nr:hypothetical protein Vadar_028311 [Vaccinium darrowii]
MTLRTGLNRSVWRRVPISVEEREELGEEARVESSQLDLRCLEGGRQLIKPAPVIEMDYCSWTTYRLCKGIPSKAAISCNGTSKFIPSAQDGTPEPKGNA